MEYMFRGVCPVINLPFHQDYTVDYDGMAAIIEMAIADGCESLCLFAFNTEPHKLTATEKKDTIIRFLDIAKGRVNTLVGIIENSIFGGIELAQLVEAHGGDGIILYPPSLSTPFGDALLGYFRTIAQSVGIAVMIQDNPRSTGVQMPMEFLLDAYRSIENFNYIKVECPIPVRKMRRLIELTDGKLKCYSGNGGIFAMDAFGAGAWGIMPGIVAAGRFVRLHQLYLDGRIDEARDIFENILPLVWYEDQSLEFYIACEKELLRHMGVIEQSLVRLPGETLSDTDKDELYALFKKIKIENDHIDYRYGEAYVLAVCQNNDEGDDMKRFLWKGHILPGKKEEYIKKHDKIWPEMIEMMREAGLRNYSIWNDGDELIGYYEFDGMEKKQRIYAAHQDVLSRWQAHMDGVMEMDQDVSSHVLMYRQVFLME